MTDEFENRFWRKVSIPADVLTGCWEWKASRMRTGYGAISRDGVVQLAHRIAYELVKGPIPAGLHLDHLCRNRGCVNPGHLEAVTNAENTQRGDGSKLTPTQVQEIRAAHATGTSQHQLARAYGVSRAQVSSIVRRRSWANV